MRTVTHFYEQGINWEYRFTSQSTGTSMGMHESQSRFFENYVGLSEAFAEPLYSAYAQALPRPVESRYFAFQLFGS